MKENQRKMQEKELRMQTEIVKKQENAEFERLIREQKKSDNFQRKLLETQQILQKQAEKDRLIEEKQRTREETRREQAEVKEKTRKEKIESIERKIREIHAEKERKARERERERLEKAIKMKEVHYKNIYILYFYI